MIIPTFRPFIGEHCETTALGNLFHHAGLTLSEPMLFGLAGGIGFIYWNMKTMPVPFLGGRAKDLTKNLRDRLGFDLRIRETSSPAKAWAHVTDAIEAGRPVGLQLDCCHLDYFTKKVHFAGHHVAMYGYDTELAYLVDTRPQGGAVRTPLENLARARKEKGPMSARHKSYTLHTGSAEIDYAALIPAAIRQNAHEFLNPPIQNLGYKGILKASVEIRKWLKTSQDPKADFGFTAGMMERAGTGGALFRNLYRDFLGEAHDLLRLDPLREAHEAFGEIARRWTYVSHLFERVRSADDTEIVREASEVLVAIADAEHRTISKLHAYCAGRGRSGH